MSLEAEQFVAEPARRAAIGAYRLELLPRQAYEAAYTPDRPVIGFAFERQTGVHAFASDRKAQFCTQANSLAFVPAGCDVYSQSRNGGEYLTLTLLGCSAAENPRIRRFNDLVKPAAIDAAYHLRRWLLDGSFRDPLVAEHHALNLAAVIAFVERNGLGEPSVARWMTPRRRRTIEALIEDKLETALTLEELAAAIGLSAGYFARAFKAAMGKPPHSYIIDRRIARARLLLRARGADLSEIAYACGFASHAHMTAQFRHRLGVTPTMLRVR